MSDMNRYGVDGVQRVRELEAEVERLSEALDNLAETAHQFSTLAEYTVEESVEVEFVAALDDAIKLLALDITARMPNISQAAGPPDKLDITAVPSHPDP